MALQLAIIEISNSIERNLLDKKSTPCGQKLRSFYFQREKFDSDVTSIFSTKIDF